ncbi:MAG TPA: ribonuclease III [Myxococcota bacterium]|nr:ribonuclease III [Myxococcota bacterium]
MTINEHDLVAAAAERLGYRFEKSELLIEAVTHKSYANEASPADEVRHNERLEFLGDAVLGLVVGDRLMSSHPGVDEGELTRMRAALVNEQSLFQAAERTAIGEWLRLGKGEERSGGRDKPSLLADLFEAILGAVYLDGGLDAARAVIERGLGKQIDTAPAKSSGFDPKSRLQVLLAQEGHEPPEYRLDHSEGPVHRQLFFVSVWTNGREIGGGRGNSKKEAEQAAARSALDKQSFGNWLVGDLETRPE